TAPVRPRPGKGVCGPTLPGPIWQAFMNAALKNDDQDEFSPYEPMGTAAYANNGGGASYGEPPTTATNDNGDNGDNGDNSDDGDKKKEKKKKRDNNDDGDNALLFPPRDL